MKLFLRALSVLLLSTGLSYNLSAQPLKVRNYSLGYRIFEMEDFGNNPFNIAPILKDPQSYLNFLNSIRYNGYSANPAPVRLETIYLNAELHKPSSSSRFWKKHSLQAGILFTLRQNITVGTVSTFQYVTSPDTAVYEDSYSLTRKTQFLGLNVGMNRRFKIINRLSLFGAVHAQGSVAILHTVQQQLDSTKLTYAVGRTTKITRLPDLKAKNYFQWQVMFPLGLEYNIYPNAFLVRLEFLPGLTGGRFRPNDFFSMSTFGAGLWLSYKLN